MKSKIIPGLIFGYSIILSIPLYAAVTLPGPLVETAWLAKNQSKVTILSVRKNLKSFTTQPKYKKNKKTGKNKLISVGGHIPGALLINYKNVRATRKINGLKVTRLIPEQKAFETFLQNSGVNKDTTLIIVSRGQNQGDITMATRLYWQLKYFGHKSIAILNGGTAQWIIDGHNISSAAPKVKQGNWVAGKINHAILANSEDVAKAIKSGDSQLLDIRSPAFFYGTYAKSYVFAKGHLRGAHNFPNELLTKPVAPTRFLTANQYRSLNKKLGISNSTKSISYCNSGHLASGSWFIRSEILGNKKDKLYDGSMHQWTLEKRPVVGL